jgi:hypothetical protein
MNRPLLLVASLILMGTMDLTGITLLAESRSPEAELSIIVHVYNYAQIPAWTLARTEKQAANYFLRAGIQLRWVDCTPSSKTGSSSQSCLWDPDPSDLVLKIVPRFDTKAEGFRDAVLGLAAASQVIIINERTEEISRSGEATYPLVLGITIAHELGHALLGPNSHSENGIMRPRFLGADFKKAQSTTLSFTPEQAEQMRTTVHQRKALQAGRKEMP